jgi:hypothetical protein
MPSGTLWTDSVDPFDMTIMLGFNRFLRALIDHRASVNGSVNNRKTPLRTAIDFRNEMLVRYPVENGANINVQDGYYGSPLHAAATTDVEMVRCLVKHGAAVDAPGGYFWGPLQAATNDPGIIRYLVENGADVNVQAAAYWGHEITVRFLAENGDDVNAQGGESPDD